VAKRKVLVSILIDPDLWDQFLYLTRREKVKDPKASASAKIREWIRAYVEGCTGKQGGRGAREVEG